MPRPRQPDYTGDFDGFAGEIVYDAEVGTDEAPQDRVLEEKWIGEGPTTLFAPLQQDALDAEAEKREKGQRPIG